MSERDRERQTQQETEERAESGRVLWPKSAVPCCRMVLKKGLTLTNTI